MGRGAQAGSTSMLTLVNRGVKGGGGGAVGAKIEIYLTFKCLRYSKVVMSLRLT